MPEPSTTDDTELYRRRSAQNWEQAAGSWEANREYTRAAFAQLTEWLRDEAGLAPGQTVLELAGGPGDMAVQLAPSIVPGGHYIVTDRAEAMVAAQRRLAEAAGLGDVIDPRVIDAEAIDLEDASADAVVCRFGLMLIPDPPAVLRETARVLRPGGRCAFIVWSTAELNPWATRLWGVFEELTNAPPTPPGAPGMFALSDQVHLARIFAEAGIEPTAIDTIEVSWRYSSFDDYWARQSSLSGGIAKALEEMSPAEQDVLTTAVREAIAEFRAPDGSYALPGQAVAVAATR